MNAEILFTRTNERDDPVPGQVTRIVNHPDAIVVHFANTNQYGLRYEGIIRLRRTLENQEIGGRYRKEVASNMWHDGAAYLIEGKFQDPDFTTFEGQWTEREGACAIAIYDLPRVPRAGNSGNVEAKGKSAVYDDLLRADQRRRNTKRRGTTRRGLNRKAKRT
jgi:hypothetical protein